MRRRDFLSLLGGASAVRPFAAYAQRSAKPVIGFLGSTTPELSVQYQRAYRQGLEELGYLEGHNVAIESRWAESQYERLPAQAAELVARPVDVITAGAFPAAVAAKAATTTIPIVFSVGVDPVAFGLVASLNRPGGNITGVTNLNQELAPKQLEVLHQLDPTSTAMAALVNPTNPNSEAHVRDLQSAALWLGLKLHLLYASTERDFEPIFKTLIELHVGGLVIGNDAFFVSRSRQLGALTASRAIPAIYQFREFAEAGGLLSYGSSLTEAYRQVGMYTGRVLKGEKPADLPVQQSTKVELILNLNTAKALGITVPPSLLSRADEVIE